MLLKGGAALQGLFLKKVPEESGLRLRFPLPYLDERRFIPSLAKDSFLEVQSGWVRAEKEVMRVGLFVGCVTNYLFPDIGKAAVDVFVRRGISVYIPENQYCCGLPAFGSGDEETPAVARPEKHRGLPGGGNREDRRPLRLLRRHAQARLSPSL